MPVFRIEQHTTAPRTVVLGRMLGSHVLGLEEPLALGDVPARCEMMAVRTGDPDALVLAFRVARADLARLPVGDFVELRAFGASSTLARSPRETSLRDAHAHAAGHRAELAASRFCGCFHCCAVFHFAELREWIPGATAATDTARCPRCGVDSVLGSRSMFPIDRAFLDAMRAYWF